MPRTAERSLFLSDKAISLGTDDELGVSEKAHNFARRIYDGGRSESLVFGIDAPWGIGKSSFLNVCEGFWREHYSDKVILFKFSPIDYPGDEFLIDHFVENFVKEIRKRIYAPELGGLSQRYLRSIEKMDNFSLFGIQLPATFFENDQDKALKEIERCLARHSKKVIVVIDDLDRIKFEHSKHLLFVIHKSFSLHNVNFLIAYDSEVLSAKNNVEAETKELIEYLEKFINVKTNLFLNSKMLEKYLKEALPRFYAGTEIEQENISAFLEGISRLITSPEFGKYKRFISDVRKLKRLVNTVMLAGLHELDLKEADIRPEDMALLLLLYVNYPSTFRDIYYAETENRTGYFSVLRDLDGEGYKNSEFYKNYINDLGDDPRVLLLKGLFDVERIPKNPTNEDFKTRACFNNEISGRTLENYLKVIVDVSEPNLADQYYFYDSRFAEIKEGTALHRVLARSEFSSEVTHEKLWSVITYRVKELDSEISNHVLDYCIDHIQDYSFLSEEGNSGLRLPQVRRIATLLNDTGRGFVDGNSDDEHLRSIWRKIFGEDGVIEKLAYPPSILSVSDLLMFRLRCSANLVGGVGNLSAALTMADFDESMRPALTSETAIARLRGLSQRIFEKFKGNYIDIEENVVSEGYLLDPSILNGKYSVPSEKKSAIESMQNQLVTFVLYQLTTKSIDSSVGCGYYDVQGAKDQGGIRTLMNEYLFETCFAVSEEQNVRNFVRYLVSGYEKDIAETNIYHPQFDHVFDRGQFLAYWERNSEVVERVFNSMSKEETVHTVNFSIPLAQLTVIDDVEQFLETSH